MSRMVHLEDVAAEVTVGHVGSMATEYIEDGIPFLRSLNVLPHRIEASEIKYISSEFHAKLKKSALKPGDVVIVRTGKPGTCAVIPSELPESNCSDLVIVRCGPDLRPRFLAYWVNTIAKDHVASHVVGAVQQHFNVGSAKKMPIRLPSLKEQDDILSILGALDDKIEVNRKTAATLEEMARALYQSWFVTFDPVHAKAAGRTPAHMPAQTAALFPDSFGEDDLPEGWELKRLGDLIKLNYGKALKKDLRIPGEFPVFGSGGVGGTHKEALVKAPTIIVGRKGTVGSLHWAPNGSWPIDTVFFVTSDYPLSLIIRLLGELPLTEMNTDAAVPGLNRDNAYRLEIPFPGAAIVQAYSEFSDVWQQKIDKLEDENRTLATLRDTLLPRLMSGELRVGEAKEQVEELA